MGLRQTKVIAAPLNQIIILLAGILVVCGCSDPKPPHWDDVHRSTEYYRSATRATGHEPVYGRFTWSHLPGPVSQKSKDDAPLINPEMSFEMPKSSLGQCIEALAQGIGFQWRMGESLKTRPISINMKGTVSDILTELAHQAQVQIDLDTRERTIIVQDEETSPRL